MKPHPPNERSASSNLLATQDAGLNVSVNVSVVVTCASAPDAARQILAALEEAGLVRPSLWRRLVALLPQRKRA